jgi:hypothetical protein
MSTKHSGFEMDCALALCGELDEQRFVALNEHAQACGGCATRLEEFVWVTSQLEAARPTRGRRWKAPEGMRERFQVRAAQEGVVFRGCKKISWPRLAVEAGAIALFMIALFSHCGKSDEPAMKPAATEIAEVRGPEVPQNSIANLLSPKWITSASNRHCRGNRGKTMQGVAISLNSPALRIRFPKSANGWDSPLSFDAKSLGLPASSRTRTPVGCTESNAAFSLLDLSGTPQRRVFCYNPRIASLTMLDLKDAAASNVPQYLAAFHLTAPAAR